MNESRFKSVFKDGYWHRVPCGPLDPLFTEHDKDKLHRDPKGFLEYDAYGHPYTEGTDLMKNHPKDKSLPDR